MSDTLREIQKYHDGRYRSVGVVYICGEIDNPDKERAFVPLDKVLEIIEIKQDGDDIKNEFDSGFVSACKSIRAAVEALKGE